MDKELKGIAKVVKDILEENEKARDNDVELYIAYVKKFEPYFIQSLRFALTKYNYISITRARRKVQSLFPHLWGKRRQERLEKMQEMFKEFNKETTPKDFEETASQEELEDFFEDR